MMDLGVFNTDKNRKKLFKIKSANRRGLILKIHHTDKENNKIRFTHCCFNLVEKILACSDNKGNIFVIDFSEAKYWNLPTLESCSLIKFSTFNTQDLIIGQNNGDIVLFNVHSQLKTGQLIGHSYPIKEISFATNSNLLCLTSSQYEGIIWDLTTNTKLQIFCLDNKKCFIKHLCFMPQTGNVLMCFEDNIIQVWKSKTFEEVITLPPVDFVIKSIAITRNGKDLILAGYSNKLAFFRTDTWEMHRTVALPDYILAIRKIVFIPQSFDGGYNKILAILSGQGVIYFYETDKNFIISELATECEIGCFDCSYTGVSDYISCCLCSGAVEVYDISLYTTQPVKMSELTATASDGKVRFRKCCSKIGLVKRELCEVLDIEKLRGILKEFGEYPESYRMTIWEHLLSLPNNKDQYNSIINRVTKVSFPDLYKKYPLEDKKSIRNLRKLLDNLVTWCPFFEHVEYLPVFCFPFVKVFNSKPISCFEALCTIILNWCQYWFEYFPLLPCNILAIIENVLLEQCPNLVHHMDNIGVTPQIYAWTLLETAFSEVLTIQQWLMFWDHVLSNEPAFLLCAVAAYNIIHKTSLLEMKVSGQFCYFYHCQNPTNIKKLITKTYQILNTTSTNMHPRQYLNAFSRIEIGHYPKFIDYPKVVLDFEEDKAQLREEATRIEQTVENLKKKSAKDEKLVEDIQNDEVKRQRLFEAEKAFKQKLLEEQNKVKEQQEKLHELQQKLQEKNLELSQYANKKLEEYSQEQKLRRMESNLLDAQLKSHTDTLQMKKEEEELTGQYNKLIEQRWKIDNLMNSERGSEILHQRLGPQESLKDNINNGTSIKQDSKLHYNTEHLKQINVATSIKAIDELISLVEKELVKQKYRSARGDESVSVEFLGNKTKDLNEQIQKLLKILNNNKRIDPGTGTGSQQPVEERSSLTTESNTNNRNIITNLRPDEKDAQEQSELNGNKQSAEEVGYLKDVNAEEQQSQTHSATKGVSNAYIVESPSDQHQRSNNGNSSQQKQEACNDKEGCVIIQSMHAFSPGSKQWRLTDLIQKPI